MAQLALLGGTPVRTEPFAAYNTIGAEEKAAVLKVLDSGNLSQFIGAWHEDYFGGPQVKAFEAQWSETFAVQHTISVNSNTSGLIAALAACGIGAGDEVIVSPYTMTASAVAPAILGAVPVFADIDPNIFGLSPDSIRACLSPRTKAILVVHIFGQPADMDPIMAIAEDYNLVVIEDCAQCPTATYKGRPAGSIGHCGVFSLNYHKHIHTGEGGMVTTNDSALAERLQLVRNHGEAVVEGKGCGHLSQIMGFNFRMPEIEAAIGIEQLKKVHALVDRRIKNAAFFAERLGGLPGFTPPLIQENCTHVYYCQPFKFDRQTVGVHRNSFVAAVKAELPPTLLRETTPLITAGYVRPLYLQPLYQQRTARCAFNCPRYDGQVSYARGLCPVAERLHFDELLTHEFMRPSMTEKDMADVVDAFHKVYENREALRHWELNGTAS